MKEYIFIALIFNHDTKVYSKARSLVKHYERDKIIRFNEWLEKLQKTLQLTETIINEKIIE